MSEAKTVFISYAREDAAIAQKIYEDLKRAGASPWIDSEHLLGGQNWKEEIQSVIESSSFFLMLLSSSSVSKRGYVQSEIRQAIDVLDQIPGHGIYIIPVRLDDCKPSQRRLGEIHWIDLFPSYEQGIKKILRVVRPPVSVDQREIASFTIEGREDLAESGWGVIFARSTDPAVREALEPLLDHRRRQATRINKDFYKEFQGDLTYQGGDSIYDFLARFGAGPGPVDPARVPFYLMIVGGPDEIPFSFQQQLAIQYRVGRIAFNRAEDYASYARSVVRSELQDLCESEKRMVLFGVKHPDDPATAFVADRLVLPLAEELSHPPEGWTIEPVPAEQGTKGQLGEYLGGSKTPQLLFLVGHGVVFSDGKGQLNCQGAILCQDWPGPVKWQGAIPSDFYFSGEDLLSDADLTGTMIFYWGSFGAGTALMEGLGGDFQAPKPFVSGLAQKLLSNPGGGALGMIGLVERGWFHSFSWRSAGPQIQAFTYALLTLMRGKPAGMAMEFFSKRYAELSAELASVLLSASAATEDTQFLETGVRDAKSYVLIGDPAVRIK